MNYPAFLRRRKPQKAERLDDQPQEQQPQQMYQQPQMAAQQAVPPGYTLMYAPNGQPYYAPVTPQPWQQVQQPQQPEMYNEIVMPADAEPLWRKGRKKDKTPQNRSPFGAPPSYPSAQTVPEQPEPVQEPEGDAVILSSSKRRALDRLEQIRKRKAEIDAELAGNEEATRSGETPPWEETAAPAAPLQNAASAQNFTPVAAQTFAPVAVPDLRARFVQSRRVCRFHADLRPCGGFPDAGCCRGQPVKTAPAAEPVDRDAAYKRPTSIAQQTGPVTRTAPVTEIHDEPRRQTPYVYPSIELLNLQQREIKDTRAQDTENAGRLEKTLESFNIPAKVQRVTHGPAVTRFKLGLPVQRRERQAHHEHRGQYRAGSGGQRRRSDRDPHPRHQPVRHRGAQPGNSVRFAG
ncbi:MAG: DNA translocase FtsK [Lachnospiraceae bacterium]